MNSVKKPTAKARERPVKKGSGKKPANRTKRKQKKNASSKGSVSSLREEVQEWLYEFAELGGTITSPLIQKLKEADEAGGLTHEIADYILNESNYKKRSRKVTLSDTKLDKYFPATYGREDIEGVIFSLLGQWKRTQEEALENE